jgi:WS/DGAT/MGAT family acyltransferase
VLDRSPDWETLEERVERATRLAPTFRSKLVTVPLGLAPPRWVVDADFDLSWHLQRAAVHPGGDLSAALAFARNTGMAAFDHDRPLWRITLLDGLPDGRAALVVKVHHALTDGIGGIQLATHVVDLERWPETAPELPELPAGERFGTIEALVDLARYGTGRVASGTLTAAGIPAALARTVRHPVEAVTELAATAASVARFVRPVSDTYSPVMRKRRTQWRYDVLDVPFGALHEAAHRGGGSLNDAFLTALSGGLRTYHERHDRDVGSLRVTMPISTRAAGDAEGGNRVTLVRFEVPVDVVDARARMRLIGERCRALRHERAIPYSNAIAATLNLLPVSITGGMLKHVDFLASNVPGFDTEVYVAGARLEAFYPFGPTLGSALNCTLMSYRDVCNIGINSDAAAVPDPEMLIESLRTGVDEVLAIE